MPVPLLGVLADAYVNADASSLTSSCVHSTGPIEQQLLTCSTSARSVNLPELPSLQQVRHPGLRSAGDISS